MWILTEDHPDAETDPRHGIQVGHERQIGGDRECRDERNPRHFEAQSFVRLLVHIDDG